MTRSVLAYAFLLTLTAALLAPSLAAAAFSQNYGDCVGSTVTWQQVTESNAGASALFGAPTCSGTTLDFDPTGFVVEVDLGPGTASVGSGLDFTVMALGDSFINELHFDESGDYTLLGFDPSTSFTKAELAVRLEITMLDDGSTVSVGHPGGGGFDMLSVTMIIPLDFATIGSWSLSGVYDINQILADNSIVGKKATKIEVEIDNTLTASADNGEIARIVKKDFGGLSVTAVNDGGGSAPEPGALSLLAMGVVGLVARRRSSS
jgi:hypothetical protein